MHDTFRYQVKKSNSQGEINKMKTTIKFISTIILTIAISYTTVLADGDMGAGSKSGGGLVENQPTISINDKKSDSTQADDFVIMIQDFFKLIFG
jgi:hypothetical protein